MVLSLLGCVAGTPEDSDPSWPSGYLLEDSAAPRLELRVEEVAEAVNDVFAQAIAINGHVLFVAYDAVMAHADPSCPPVDASEDGGSLWDTNCVAESGARYAGFISVFRGFQGDEYNSNLRGEATVLSPDGSRLVVAGDAHTTINEVARVWKSAVDGVMYYDGPGSEGSWVLGSPDVRMAYTLEANTAQELIAATLDGSVGSLEGAVSAVSLNEVVMRQDENFPCPVEPYGTLSVRDAHGSWGDVVFDVGLGEAGEYIVDAERCDGCGTLWFGGEDLGQVCVDPLNTLNTELPPW